MSDFLSKQWKELQDRTRSSADYHAERNPERRDQIVRDRDAFCALGEIESYQDLLARTRQAGELAVAWSGDSSVAVGDTERETIDA